MNTQVTHRTVLVVALALFALWGTSWALSYVDLGHFALPVAITIAAAKAVLVALFFMELVSERFTVRVPVIVAGLLIALMIGLMAADIATRFRPPYSAPGRTSPYTTFTP
jgi:cytochrome c oxidase subunit 4